MVNDKPKHNSTFTIKHSTFLVALLLLAPCAFAWGEKGHQIVADAAELSLPNDIPPFFYQSFPTLTYLGDEPDRWRGGGDSLNAENEPNHFLDSEYVAGLTLPNDRYAYVGLLVSSGTLRKHGISIANAGLLPWRIAELSEQLTAEWRIWRRSNGAERAEAEREIIETAGLLGHYIADASQPLHTTFHFNGWGDAVNPNHYANDCDVHARFETWFINHEIETSNVVPLIAAPKLRSDYFATALAFVRESNALVDNLYRIDRDGGFVKATPESRAFAAERIAAGAAMLRDVWWSAWKNSATPRGRRAPQPPPE
jgi:hypothetical protein